MEGWINEFGVVTWWPKKGSDKEYIIKYLSKKFRSDLEYSEKEVNQIIKRYHSFNDFALLRRELISKKYLFRTDDCSKYWKSWKPYLLGFLISLFQPKKLNLILKNGGYTMDKKGSLILE